MEITVKQETLAKALNNVSKVAAGIRATLPILNNVLIRANDNKVTLTTTNLDMAMVDYLPVSGADNGVITVPARLLAEFVSNLPRGTMVKLRTEGTRVMIQAGEYSSSINGTAADEFPELPEIDEKKAAKITLPMGVFRESLTQVMMAVSNDTTRPTLTGAYFNTADGALYVVATDGYRLAERKMLKKVGAEVAAIVPGASLRSVLGLVDDEVEEIELLFDEAQVRFRMGEMEVTSKILDGSFPDYRRLIPENSEIRIELPHDELTRVTKLAALFAQTVGGSVSLTADAEKEAVIVSSPASELGENNSEIKTKVEKSGKTTIKARYLLDALNVMKSETVWVRFSDGGGPIIVWDEKNKDYTHLIMPLRG